jgi:mutator protein MutT
MYSLVFQEPPESFNPKVEVAACFITVDEDVLFMKRQPHKSEGNLWGIPGGKCEKGETAEEAVLREIKEETGLDLLRQSLQCFGKVYIRYPEIDFTYHMFGYNLPEYPEEIVIDSKEHTEYLWTTLREALKLPLIRGEDECIHLVLKDQRIG